MKPALPKNALIAVSLLAVCFLTYANSLGNDFLLDDLTLILNASFSPEFLQLLPPQTPNAVYFRPLTHLFCAFNHALFGTNPVGYQLINLLIFYLACLSFYHVVLRLFNNSMLSLVAALFLAVHPINGVLVNYKVATGYSFLIVALNLSLLWMTKDRKRPIDYAISGLWFAAALFCHEIAVVFPFYWAAMLLIARKETLKNTLIKCLPSIGILSGYLFLRGYFIGPKITALENASTMASSPTYYLAAWAKTMWWYLSQMIMPTHVVLVQDITMAPDQILQWAMIFIFSVCILIFLLIRYRSNNAASLGLWWFIISFVPVTAACFSRPEMGIIVQPHWLTFGSLGFFLWIAAIFVKIQSHIHRILWLGLLFILLSSYMISAIHHNKFWVDQKTYCRYWLNYSPRNFWANFNLGNCYLVEGNYIEAKKYFLRAVINGKAGSQVWNSLESVERYLEKKGRSPETTSNP